MTFDSSMLQPDQQWRLPLWVCTEPGGVRQRCHWTFPGTWPCKIKQHRFFIRPYLCNCLFTPGVPVRNSPQPAMSVYKATIGSGQALWFGLLCVVSNLPWLSQSLLIISVKSCFLQTSVTCMLYYEHVLQIRPSLFSHLKNKNIKLCNGNV